MEEKKSTVTIRENQKQKTVSIANDFMPGINDDIISRWQSLIDIAARLANVPSGLIMKLNETTLEVFLASKTKGNPYEVGGKEKLIYGLYCENVIGQQKKLLVPDATKSTIWKDNNPDVAIDMISYLGFPINWPSGEVFGTVCLLDNKENHYNSDYIEMLFNIKQNIDTDLHLLISNEKVIKSNKKLSELNATKDKFFSIISHDLRNPFNAILGFSEILLRHHKEYDDEKREKTIKIVNDSANSAFKLLENLLTWSYSQSKKITYIPEELHLKTLLSETLSNLQETAKMKNIQVLDTTYENDIIFADKNMIATVFRNLISNAIKFTPKNGTITISSEKQANSNFIEISVTDTGVGIPKDKIDDLFRIDKKTSTKGTENEKGTGLGLILCKEFVEKHGGKIWVESEIEKGTTVSFTIPFKSIN